MKKFEVISNVQYIPRNPWRPWVKTGQRSFYFAKSKKDLLKYFEPEARKLVKKGMIKIKKVM